MTAIGKGFVAQLVTSQRGPVMTRKVQTRTDAFAVARELLEEADRLDSHQGETVGVQVAQAEG